MEKTLKIEALQWVWIFQLFIKETVQAMKILKVWKVITLIGNRVKTNVFWENKQLTCVVNK
jgi:hypothetical protein